jgi:non-heme chloroperoxidase
MPTLTVGSENSAKINLHYDDHGSGRPVLLVHGYPLNSTSWEHQERALLEAGYRVISYDRRGFGRSSQPSIGFDCDTLARDLNAVVERLGLTDASVVGASIGTGEIVRYLAKWGSGRITKAALIGSLPPFLLRTDDNPAGIGPSVFEDIKAAITADRYAYFEEFFNNAYNVDALGGRRVSDQAWYASFIIAVGASPQATVACLDSWLTDFRSDLTKINVPTLVVHGLADRIFPYDATAARLPALISDTRVVLIDDGPHLVAWTHYEEVNQALLSFLAE